MASCCGGLSDLPAGIACGDCCMAAVTGGRVAGVAATRTGDMGVWAPVLVVCGGGGGAGSQ